MNNVIKINSTKSINDPMQIMSQQIERLQAPGCNVAKEARRAQATATCTSKIYQGMALQLRYAKERDGVPMIAAADPAPTAEEIKAAQAIPKRAKGNA